MLFSACSAVSVHTRIDPLDLAADTILEPSCILNEPAVLVLEGAHKLGFSCEENLRNKLRIPAINLNQQILVSEELEQTSRVMVKDEDVCLHCGLCAERCPTGAWDMQNFLYQEAKAYS